MKSILFNRISLSLFALLSTILISFTSCDKKNGEDPQPTIDSIKQVLEDEEEEETDNLPPHYFKAKYNGVELEADTCFFWYLTSTRPDSIEFKIRAEYDTMIISMEIQMPLAELSGGCIPDKEFNFVKEPYWLNNLNIEFLTNPSQASYGFTKEGGKTVITDCNYSNRTITGTFSYTKMNGLPGDTVRITDGQFRVPLMEVLNWFN